MILEVFKDSFEYSLKDPKSILKLGVLLLFSIFIIPLFFVAGYSYRITNIGLNGTINGEDSLPNFKKWRLMFIQGIKIIIVRFVYLLPGTILLLLFHENYESIEMSTSSIIAPYMGIMALTIVFWLIFYLFSILAIPNMINNKGSLKSAFNFKEIISIFRSIGFFRYIKFYLGCIVLFIGLSGTLFFMILLIGSSIAFLIGFSQFNHFIFLSSITSIFSIILTLYLIPFFLTFESRAIALIYNMRELN